MELIYEEWAACYLNKIVRICDIEDGKLWVVRICMLLGGDCANQVIFQLMNDRNP